MVSHWCPKIFLNFMFPEQVTKYKGLHKCMVNINHYNCFFLLPFAFFRIPNSIFLLKFHQVLHTCSIWECDLAEGHPTPFVNCLRLYLQIQYPCIYIVHISNHKMFNILQNWTRTLIIIHLNVMNVYYILHNPRNHCINLQEKRN